MKVGVGGGGDGGVSDASGLMHGLGGSGFTADIIALGTSMGGVEVAMLVLVKLSPCRLVLPLLEARQPLRRPVCRGGTR